MTRKASSQWEFGELFVENEMRKVLSVSELTLQVRRLLEKQIGSVWVTGEVSNLRVQASGHVYFTLKDPESQVSCVLFRGETVDGRTLIDNGVKLTVQGDLSVYEPRGQYQLIIRKLELLGVGALQIAFEKLKRRLHEAGYFDAARKKPLPTYPQRIGLVTSPSGAAIRDVLHVIRRRQPGLEIVFVPARVQGQGAAGEIAAGIRLLNELAATATASKPDLVLITRGGGSLEDLWAFNEEVVAEAIHQSVLPVVSAVGHEIDFTISDFVADLRAATPSAAAELITEGPYSSLEFVREARRSIQKLAHQQLADARESFAQLNGRLIRLNPLRKVQDSMQRLDELGTDLARALQSGLRAARAELDHRNARLIQTRPVASIQRLRERVRIAREQLEQSFRRWIERKRFQFQRLESQLKLLSPDETLDRGYTITTTADTGALVRRPPQAGTRIRTRSSSGSFESTVE